MVTRKPPAANTTLNFSQCWFFLIFKQSFESNQNKRVNYTDFLINSTIYVVE